jgi:hypothetical protein
VSPGETTGVSPGDTTGAAALEPAEADLAELNDIPQP